MEEMILKEWYNRGKNIHRGKGNLKEIRYYIDDNGCHICTSHFKSNNGKKYPTITFNGMKTSLSRYVWLLNTKEIVDSGIQVCHKCDNPNCINFEHLFLGTPKDNSEDMAIKGRQKRHSNLSNKDVFDIKSNFTNTSTELAISYGVTHSTICRIWNEEIYSHIKVENYEYVCKKRLDNSKSKMVNKKYNIDDDDLFNLTHKEAKEKYGISKSQFYNLRKIKREMLSDGN